jgi:hypothetical protein
MKRVQRSEGVPGAYLLESVFYGGAGRLQPLPDRLRDFWSLLSDPCLRVVEKLVKSALAENQLLVPGNQVAKSEPETHSRKNGGCQVEVALLSVSGRLGRGLSGCIRARFAWRLFIVRCGPRSERLDFGKFAHSDVPRFETRTLDILFKLPEHTPA